VDNSGNAIISINKYVKNVTVARMMPITYMLLFRCRFLSFSL